MARPFDGLLYLLLLGQAMLESLAAFTPWGSYDGTFASECAALFNVFITMCGFAPAAFFAATGGPSDGLLAEAARFSIWAAVAKAGVDAVCAAAALGSSIKEYGEDERTDGEK